MVPRSSRTRSRALTLGVVTIILAVTVATWGVRKRSGASDDRALGGPPSAAPPAPPPRDPTGVGDIVISAPAK